MPVDRSIVADLYRKYLGRDPDLLGLKYFTEFPNQTEIAWGLVQSDEYKRKQKPLLPSSPLIWKFCVCRKAALLYIPIPKCAHTTIVGALAHLEGKTWEYSTIRDNLTADYGNDDDKLHVALTEKNDGLFLKELMPNECFEILDSKDFVRVAVVRNPVERILSAYNHFFVQGRQNPVYQRHAQQVWDFYDQQRGDYVSLEQFLYFLKATSLLQMDHHWLPQIEFVKNMRIDLCIPVNRLDIFEDLLTRRSGYKVEMQARNVRNSQALSPTLAPAQIDAIRELYWADTLLFEKAMAQAAEYQIADE
jgi:hypothetical protein